MFEKQNTVKVSHIRFLIIWSPSIPIPLIRMFWIVWEKILIVYVWWNYFGYCISQVTHMIHSVSFTCLQLTQQSHSNYYSKSNGLTFIFCLVRINVKIANWIILKRQNYQIVWNFGYFVTKYFPYYLKFNNQFHTFSVCLCTSITLLFWILKFCNLSKWRILNI